MRKSTNIISTLSRVVRETTKAYRSDWKEDIRLLREAATVPTLEGRSLLWMCRPAGTWLVNERAAFLRDSEDFKIWTHYAKENKGFRAYRVVLDYQAEETEKLSGLLEPLDYAVHVERVQRTALPIHHVSGQFCDGERFAMLYVELTREMEIAHHGILKLKCYPESDSELDDLLSQEHALEIKESRQRKRKAPIR